MANVRYRLWGLSGGGKTCTALTARGRQAVIDRDNQMFMYWKNPAALEVFSPFAVMLGDFSGRGPDGKPLAKGSPAVWLAMDPAETTRDKVREFARLAGLGKGDQLVDDPFSALWEMSTDAADVKFGQRGVKVDWSAIKHPTATLMNLYKGALYDVCFTAHQKAEWSKDKNAPVDGAVTPTGEGQRTPRDIMFEFRIERDDKGRRMYVTKEKGFGQVFKLGERFEEPVLREIFAARGLYDFCDGLTEVEQGEMTDASADALLSRPSELATSAKESLISGLTEAAKAGKLSEFRADPANRRLVGGLPKADQGEIKILADSLAAPKAS